MNLKQGIAAALLLASWGALAGAPGDARGSLPLTLIPPPSEAARFPEYFGFSTYQAVGQTLQLRASQVQCEEFIQKYRRLHYSLNLKPGGTKCGADNLIEVPRFFLPHPPQQISAQHQ